MPRSYKWFRFIRGPSLSEMASKLSRAELDFDRGYGFSVTAEKDSIAFQYSFLNNVSVVMLDEYGAPYTSSISSVETVSCALRSGKEGNLLEVIDGARSARRIVNDIELVANSPVVVETCIPGLNAVIGALSEVAIVKVKAMRLSGLTLGSGLTAALDLRSGDSIDTDTIDLLRGQNFVVESCTLEVLRQGIRGTVSVLPSGVVRVGGDLEPLIAELVRQVVALASHGERTGTR